MRLINDHKDNLPTKNETGFSILESYTNKLIKFLSKEKEMCRCSDVYNAIGDDLYVPVDEYSQKYYLFRNGAMYYKFYYEIYSKLKAIVGDNFTPNILSIGAGSCIDYLAAKDVFTAGGFYDGIDIIDWVSPFGRTAEILDVKDITEDKVKDKNIIIFPFSYRNILYGKKVDVFNNLCLYIGNSKSPVYLVCIETNTSRFDRNFILKNNDNSIIRFNKERKLDAYDLYKKTTDVLDSIKSCKEKNEKECYIDPKKRIVGTTSYYGIIKEFVL